MKFNDINLETINILEFIENYEFITSKDLIIELFEIYNNASSAVKCLIEVLQVDLNIFDDIKNLDQNIIFYKQLLCLSKDELEYFTKFCLIISILSGKHIPDSSQFQDNELLYSKIINNVIQRSYTYSADVPFCNSMIRKLFLFKKDYLSHKKDYSNIIYFIKYMYTCAILMKKDGFKNKRTLKNLYEMINYTKIFKDIINSIFDELLKCNEKEYKKFIMELRLS